MNKKFFIRFLTLQIFFACAGICQTFEISGSIRDAKTNKPLEFVTVKVADTSFGTTGGKDGKFFVRLKPGSYKLIFSYIGYFTDTSYFYLEDSSIVRDIFLKPSEILTEQIDVFGEDPAYEIIRKAIRYKKKFKSTLNEYEYDAYSKFIIRSNRSIIPGKEIPRDTSGKKKIPIFGILESETKGYFKKPNLEKQIVTAKKETANIARGFALPLILNFYDEDIDLQEFTIPAPLADDAFGNYEYRLEGTTSIDSTRIFKIKVINKTESRPLLHGTIYIADSLFSLMRVDLSTNDAAKPLGINKIIFKQKFTSFKDVKNPSENYWMPTDVQIYADGSFLSVINFEAEVFTIVSRYEINKTAPKGIFDEFVIKVMPDANKDTAYWKSRELIKNSKEEKKAYNIIKKETKKKENSLGFSFTSMNLGSKYNSSVINYYRFNRVEGSALSFNFSYREKLNKMNAYFKFGYGTSDKKSKYEIQYTGRFLNDRRLRFHAEFYKKLQPLSLKELAGISEFYNSGTALFDKKDNLDYYYATGYYLDLNYKLIPQFGIGLNFFQEKQRTAYKNTNFSFRKKEVEFIDNPQINEAFQRVIGIQFDIDANKYDAIDWGTGDISRFRRTNIPELRLGFYYSGKDLLNSTYEYRKYVVNLVGRNYFNNLFNIRYKAGIEYQNGQVPFQSLSYFKSSTGTIDIGMGFNAMTYQEFLGDRIFYFHFENNFGKILWGAVPYINKWNLIWFFGAGRNLITDQNFELASYKNFTISRGLYMETGFGISRLLDIFRVNFAWRLNNPEKDKGGVYMNLIVDSF